MMHSVHLSLGTLYLLFVFVYKAAADHHQLDHNHLHKRQPIAPASHELSLASGAEPVNFTWEAPSDLRHLLTRQGGLEASASGQIGGGSSSASSNDYSCGPGKKCGNGACCGKDGWCGYGPTYCGDDCQSDCDAEAECGEFASPAGKGCPLNVCCSEFGFCGTTSEFCDDGCQSHCDQPKPSVGKSDTQQKIVGYYEGWSLNRPCGTMSPEEIPVHSLTHLIFAFGFITPGDFRITNMGDVSPSMFGRVTDLKTKNPNLKVMIALGGWTFNDPGPWQSVFGSLASSSANRQKFIKNLLGFLSQYGFDGVDLDWEYPGAEDRGGSETDGINLTALVKEISAAFKADGHGYLLTFTAPTSYWYLRHFDIKATSENVDWINLMSYDLHGVWDRDNPIGNHVLAHTNLTEIDLALDLLWRNDVDPAKIVLGVGFYGRSFKLQDSSCWKPGCLFSGAGDKGPCTGEGGILSYKEIDDIIVSTKAKPYYDDDAGVNYLTYGQGNWVSFDDPKSFQKKVDFANDRGLNGLMIWAIDIDNAKGDALRAITGKDIDESDDDSDVLAFAQNNAPSVSHSTDDPSKCYISECSAFCAPGWTTVTRANTDKDGKNRCDTGDAYKARRVCCPSFASPNPDDCHWADQRSSAVNSDCNGKCDIGEIQLVSDSFGWEGTIEGGEYGDQCLRGAKVFCCPAGNMERYLDICTWSDCNKECPSEKPHILTTDTGGPKANKRCSGDASRGGDPINLEAPPGTRSLCCPKEDSFKNCHWESKKVCSGSCSIDQITLDLDPRGPKGDGRSCDNGREQAYCCDPPGGLDKPFTPFDLENLFPPEYLPPPDAIPSYDLISFAGLFDHPTKREEPNLSGVAFFLIAGSSTAVTSMKKRDNPGLEFLDCPQDILSQPDHEQQTARVICLTANVTECFQVRQGGVEGTVVQMPDECGGPSWARAVSLQVSRDQHVSEHIAKRGPTSAVYDFTFDYNMPLVRRDAGDFSIRLDYSNVAGYWNAVVDSPGKKRKKRSLNELVNRFYSSVPQDWYDAFGGLTVNDRSAIEVNEDLRNLVYNKGEICEFDDGQSIGEGISIAIEGRTKVNSYFGFSLIATWNPSSTVKVHEAAGFYRPEGSTDATFKVAGNGAFDTSESLQGDIITKTFGARSMGGHSLYRGWAYFDTYMERGIKLQTAGGRSGAIAFSGYMEGRVVSDFGRFTVDFPVGAVDSPGLGTGDGERKADQVSKGKNTLKPISDAPSGHITVSSTIKLGLQVGMSFQKPYQFAVDGKLPDMSISQEVFAKFSISGTKDEACLGTSLGTRMRSHLDRGSYVGWMDKDDRDYVQELTRSGDRECFNGDSAERLKKRLDNQNPHADLVARVGDDPDFGEIPLPGYNLGDDSWNNMKPLINCNGCGSCTVDSPVQEPCCGCACLICKYGAIQDTRLDNGPTLNIETGMSKRGMPPNASDVTALELSFESSTLVERDSPNLSTGTKRVNFCGQQVLSDSYVAYPDYKTNPNTNKDFDNDQRGRTQQIRKYFHNSSSLCTSWSVVKFGQADRTWDRDTIPAGYRHQFYQTEHVFEAQTISRFLDGWMQGSRATTARNCAWIKQYLSNRSAPWIGAGSSTARLMAQELGSTQRQDRLAVFLTNANRIKGRLFNDVTAVSGADFDQLEAGDEQLTFAKELGMVFTYVNDNDAWTAFCDAFDGIFNLLVQFDNWYSANVNDPSPSDLATNWAAHVRNDLDAIVLRGRETAMALYNNRKAVPGIWRPWWALKWYAVYTAGNPFYQYGKIKMDSMCPNLPPTGV